MRILSYFIILIIVSSIISCGEKKDNKEAVPETSAHKAEAKDTTQQQQPETLPDTSLITEIVDLRTNFGNIKVGMYGREAPKTVNNFTGLILKGFYNGILFHRIVRGFVIQAGDPLSKDKNAKDRWGTGGESIYGGQFEDEINTNYPCYKAGYFKGVLAMANLGPNTNTSQFFICLDGAKRLPPKYTIFGRVLDGMDVVEKIGNVPVEPSQRGQYDGIPVNPVVIKLAKIVDNK